MNYLENKSCFSREKMKGAVMFKLCSVFIFLLAINIDLTGSLSLDEELTITYSQKVALDKVRLFTISCYANPTC